MDEAKGLNPYFEGSFDGESAEVVALRLALVKERDELRADLKSRFRRPKNQQTTARSERAFLRQHRDKSGTMQRPAQCWQRRPRSGVMPQTEKSAGT